MTTNCWNVKRDSEDTSVQKDTASCFKDTVLDVFNCGLFVNYLPNPGIHTKLLSAH